MLQGFVSNQGNGWEVTIEELGRYFERALALRRPTVSHDDARAWAFGAALRPAAGRGRSDRRRTW